MKTEGETPTTILPFSHPGYSRRRVLGLFAGTTGAGLMAAMGMGATSAVAANSTARWRGLALGGQASMVLVHEDGTKAKAGLDKAVAELKRLEQIFSVYNPKSAVSRLNRDGVLVDPPMELVALLSRAQSLHQATAGIFDITVQPLWERANDPGSRLSEKASIKALIGQEHISFDSHKIELGKGQRITLNGIAQGAITDHLVQTLKQEGYGDILLNTGEIRALGRSPDGDKWKVSIGDKDGPRISLNQMAMATSAHAAHGVHLFNPRSGQQGSRFETVTVLASNATLADGLSTALSVTPENDWAEIIANFEKGTLYTFAKRLDGSRFSSANWREVSL